MTMFNRYRRSLLTLGLAALVSVAVAACGGTTGTSGSATDVAPPASAAAVVTGPAEAPLAQAAPQPAVQPPQAQSTAPRRDQEAAPVATNLDAHTIVAAQEEVLAGIYESVLPSVVHIEVAQKADGPQGGVSPQDIPPQFRRFYDRPDGQQGEQPREFFRRGEGHVVTNHHVIADADRVTVIFADGLEVEAKVLGSDPDADLAVLKVDLPANRLKGVALGDSNQLKVGQLAVAIGNPFGQDFTMTSGIVSALGRTIRSTDGPFSNPQIIQTDAPINPGNSGGPLLDRLGRVIGINSQIISRSGASAGVGFRRSREYRQARRPRAHSPREVRVRLPGHQWRLLTP